MDYRPAHLQGRVGEASNPGPEAVIDSEVEAP